MSTSGCYQIRLNICHHFNIRQNVFSIAKGKNILLAFIAQEKLNQPLLLYYHNAMPDAMDFSQIAVDFVDVNE